jgi:hypothetical protein
MVSHSVLAGPDHFEIALGNLVQWSGKRHGRLAIPEVFFDPLDRVSNVNGCALALIALLLLVYSLMVSLQ